jgi:hypothetical protein
MEYPIFGVPQFDGKNGQRYEMWTIKMKFFLQALGYDVWKSIVTGYTAKNKSNTKTKQELKRNKKIAMDFIWELFPDLVREKVVKYSLAKQL